MARTLVLGNGMPGAEKQALALAEKIGLPYTLCHKLPGMAQLPTAMQLAACRSEFGRNLLGLSNVQPPHPTVAISCGRGSIPASVALKAASQDETLTVHVQRPACSESRFDLVVAPRHDYCNGPPPPPNVLLTDGALHNVTKTSLRSARLAWAAEMEPLPAPRLAVLIGGTVSRRWWQRPLAPESSAESLTTLLHSAASAVGHLGGSLLLATSRRTPIEARLSLETTLTGLPVPARAWGPEATPNPYEGLLSWADHLLVTADSVSMVSEACGTGKPVYVAGPRECSRRFLAFHEGLLAANRTREWCGVLEPTSSILQKPGMEDEEISEASTDTALAAARVRRMLGERDVETGIS